MGLDSTNSSAPKNDGAVLQQGDNSSTGHTNIDWMKGIDVVGMPLGQVKNGEVIGAGKVGAGAGDSISHSKDGIDSIHHINAGPSETDRIEAAQALQTRIDRVVPATEREHLTDLANAFTGGDLQKFGDAIKNIPPDQLKGTIEDLNALLISQHCKTAVDLTADGNVLLSERGRDTALQFDSRTGEVTTRAVEPLQSGGFRVLPGEVMHVDQNRVFDSIGDNAIDRINHQFAVGEPFNPGPIVGPVPRVLYNGSKAVGGGFKLHDMELMQLEGKQMHE